MNHTVLTTSFPTRPGDAAGHFVQTEALALIRNGPVSILAAGQGEPPGAEAEYSLTWLGGARLFGSPGALERIKSAPFSLVQLPGVLRRARRLLETAHGTLIVHWLIPFGYLAARIQNARAAADRFDRLEVIAHGSDVRLLLACPAPLRRAVVRELARAGAELRFVSESLRTDLAGSLPAPLARFVLSAKVRAAALELATVAPRLFARENLRIPPEARIVLFVGRLIAGKRPAEALRSASLIPGAQIYCLGDGPERSALEREFPDVHFLGQVDRDVCLTWMRAADLLISTSKHEGSPGAIREALALGTTVVAVPAGDLSERVKSEPNLHLVGEANLSYL